MGRFGTFIRASVGCAVDGTVGTGSGAIVGTIAGAPLGPAGAAVGAEVGAVLGGMYGCLAGGGIDVGAAVEEIGHALATAWRRWTRRRHKPAPSAPPPDLDEALALIEASFAARPGATFHVQGSDGVWRPVRASFALHPSVLAELYGPGAAHFDAEGLLGLWWGFWSKTLRERPEWSKAARLLFTITRVGDFLTRAPEGARIEQWPLLPPPPAPPRVVELRRADEVAVERWTRAEPLPLEELALYGLGSILGTMLPKPSSARRAA